MDLLLSHIQNKKERGGDLTSNCDLKLYQYDNLIHYVCLLYTSDAADE